MGLHTFLSVTVIKTTKWGSSTDETSKNPSRDVWHDASSNLQCQAFGVSNRINFLKWVECNRQYVKLNLCMFY